jgi:hypothetical protein
MVALAAGTPRQQSLRKTFSHRLVKGITVEGTAGETLASRGHDEIQRLAYREAGLGELLHRSRTDEGLEPRVVGHQRRGEDRRISTRDDVRRAAHGVDGHDVGGFGLAVRPRVERDGRPARRVLL